MKNFGILTIGVMFFIILLSGCGRARVEETGNVLREQNSIVETPEFIDTDSDGLPDYVEKEKGLDPLKKDSDDDGFLDNEELLYETDPLNPDTDGDGFLDGDEVKGGFDPLKSGERLRVPPGSSI